MRGQRHELRVVHVLSALRQLLDLFHDLGHLFVGDEDAVLVELLLDRMRPAVLPQDDGALHPDQLRTERLVGGGVLEHPVDVYPGFVREGVVPHDGLVVRDRNAGDPGDQFGRVADALGVHVGGDVVERHEAEDHLFQCRVARPFAQTIDADMDLAGPLPYGRQGVGHGQSEVVVAVDRQGHFGELHNFPDQVLHRRRRHGAHRVRQVDLVNPGILDGGMHLPEEPDVGPGSVLAGHLHGETVGLGVLHRIHRPVQYLLPGHLELVLEMDVRGGDERVHVVEPAVQHRIDIGPGRSGQAAHPCFEVEGHDLPDGLPFTGRGDRESRLDDIDTEVAQGGRDLHLVIYREGYARGLFPVPEGGIEYQDLLRQRTGQGKAVELTGIDAVPVIRDLFRVLTIVRSKVVHYNHL